MERTGMPRRRRSHKKYIWMERGVTAGDPGNLRSPPAFSSGFSNPSRVTCHLTKKSDADAAISFEFCGYARHCTEDERAEKSVSWVKVRETLGFCGLGLPNQLTSANGYHVIYHVLCPAEDLQHFCHVLEHY